MKKKEVNRLLFQYESDQFYINLWKQLFNESYYPIGKIEKYYQSLLQNTYSFLTSFYSLSQLLEFYFLFLILFQNNYFSSSSFQYKNIGDEHYAGRSIMAGYGNYFHIAHFLQDILNCTNQSLFHSFYIEAFLTKNILEEEHAICGKNGRFYFPPNHGLILASSPIGTFLLDPSLKDIFNSYHLLDSSFPFVCHSILEEFEMTLVPESLISAGLNRKEIVNYLLKLQKQQLITKKELQSIQMEVQIKMKNHQNQMVDFRNENSQNLGQINRFLQKRKIFK